MYTDKENYVIVKIWRFGIKKYSSSLIYIVFQFYIFCIILICFYKILTSMDNSINFLRNQSDLALCDGATQ